jgi:DNA-directed RNA polymerase specialized sigma24 family protein
VLVSVLGGGPEHGRPKLLGDEADLFRQFNSQLVRTVQRRTSTSREIVDDACAFAWQQFMQHQPDRERNWRAWMVTTAEREAWRLHRAEVGHVSLSIDDGGAPASWDRADERDKAAIRLRLREALRAFARLPEARREIKALQITGFSYDEIAEMRGLTYTRVNHLLAEANATLREVQARSAAVRIDGPRRAVRLDELEQDPPTWLRRAIGRRPSVANERRAVLAWRRAALTIDDYRRQYGRGLGDDTLGERPAIETPLKRSISPARRSSELSTLDRGALGAGSSADRGGELTPWIAGSGVVNRNRNLQSF